MSTHTVLDIELDFTNFPEFDDMDKETAKELALGDYDALDPLQTVIMITKLYKFPVLSAIVKNKYGNTHVRFTGEKGKKVG